MATQQDYPLFDRLREKSAARDVSIDVKRLSSTINAISSSPSEDAIRHYREIAALILHYEIISGRNPTLLSYDSKVMIGGKGILFYVEKLPVELLRIIAQYVEDPNS